MKHLIKLAFLLLALLLPATATAHDFMVNGIYYNILNDNEVAVTYRGENSSHYNEYFGSVTIPSSVTYNGTTYSVNTIGNCAFSNCSALTRIYIPNSVTTIGSQAFSGCRGLASIEIPNSVTTIGGSAFSYCSGLTSMTIPNSVTYIGVSAFENCNNLNEVYSYITDLSNISMGTFVFYFNSDEYEERTLYVPIGTSAAYQSDTRWSDYFGPIVEMEETILVSSIELNEPSKEMAVGYTLQLIANNLPANAANKSVIWSSSNPAVATVDSNGLVTAKDLGSAIITAMTTDGSNLSASCTITVVNSNIISFADANVKALCVQNWDKNGDGELSEFEAAVVTDLGSVFQSNKSITSFDELQYFTGLESIRYNAFYNCSNLASVTIPKYVSSIDIFINIFIFGSRGAFYGCNSLTSITVVSGNTTYDSRNNCNAIIETASNSLILGCKSTIIPNSVTSINDYAFCGCSSLTSITIPNSVTTIGSSAFEGCCGLDIVTIPNSITSIKDYAFRRCSSLASIEIPNSVITIEHAAFERCNGLTSITIGNSVTSIGEDAFYGCSSLANITVANENTTFDSRNNCNAIIETASNTLITGCKNTIIPNSIISIASLAFYDCSGLASIEIPSSVTSIGYGAFYGCSGLTSITVASDNTTFDSRNNCNAIIETVSNTLITGCMNTIIPNSITSIGDEAFWRCNGLTSITIPNSVTSIGYGAFSTCNSLNEVFSCITDLSSISMEDYVFYRDPANYEERTLFVPAGTSADYQADTRWSDYFGSIVEMDEPTYDNYLSIPDGEAFHGDTIVVPVKMFNEADVISFQTDIFLPEGLELLQEDGEYIIDPSERMTRTHSIMSDNVSNGSIRVLCYSSNYKPFTGNSGDDLFYLTLKVADDAEGDYTIQLKNTLLTNTDFVDMPAPDVAATVNVKAYILGDANNSRLVTVGDVVATAQYVLEQNPQPFIFEAADVNFDGTITVADVSRIAWMVLNPGAKAPRRAPAVLNSGDRMSGEGISLMQGETSKVSIALDNVMDYSAFQLDLSLPEGLTASNFQLTDRAGSHAFDVNTLGGGKFRALCYSPALTAINGHEGALLTFDVTANSAVTGSITVDGIELVTTACESVRLDGFAIDVNSASGVNEQVAGKTVARVDYYNLAGQQIDRPEAGVTLVVTTYTDGTRATTKIVR